MNLHAFMSAVLRQDAAELRNYFHENACIRWHCTNELFTVEEFITANCEYPGDWGGEIDRIEHSDNLWITATHVYPKDRSASFHVTSFIRIQDGKILEMDEYWADDSNPPQWRRNMNIGKPIK